MPLSLADKAERLRQLHAAPEPLLIANAWDAGSAKMFAELGFEALATSSAAAAGVLGRRDGQISRAESIAHAQAIAAATELPVSADLENGFGTDPSEAAETIRRAGAVGVVGGSIEDASGDSAAPIFAFAQAVERIAAAVEAARALPFAFVLTARAENFLHGRADLDDTIRRLQAYEQAGADVLFAPGLPDLAAVRAVCAAVKRPVNFMVGMRGRSFSVAELREAGVRRISFSTSLYRAAMAGARSAGQEILQQGQFGYLDRL